jgi:hypothetical protein
MRAALAPGSAAEDGRAAAARRTPLEMGREESHKVRGLCRVKGARPPHIPMRHSELQHNVAAQRLWRMEATQCCVWRSEASFLANLWQGRITN